MYHQALVKVVSVLFEDHKKQWIITDQFSGRAILYKSVLEPVKAGDDIYVNITAYHLNLGTGGYDIVVSKQISPETVTRNEQGGHIIKLRYTPNQHSVQAIDAQESPYHTLFEKDFSLEGKKVLLAELHSMVPLIWSFARQLNEQLKITFIFDEQAALALPISKHLERLEKEKGFHSITIGQAFGGEYEATTLQNALQFADQYLRSDLIVVSVGPGVVGTGTKYGFSGIHLANWANIIGALQGVPVWVPRISFADKRERQRGVSHHTRTALMEFTYAKSILPLPYLQQDRMQLIKQQLAHAKSLTEHTVIISTKKANFEHIRKAVTIFEDEITTMNRSFAEDPDYFCGVFEATRVSLGFVE
ncbi:DUF3866 family protein [Alkalihalobacillus pseudalcaliphilus]|uniref:DUF3866 family protein n=1 Tax=Alkalihalobacillus pseudalcaliphilus TaxID=79884 RepID=UPI00064D9D4B|nr:DUF3866 family protein [Alkalihalobacillus pseudalcaliphilus]KMK76096.1 hypothetical protein AB990_12770 [Alkalihalobacillus pseudalcaliphilus]